MKKIYLSSTADFSQYRRLGDAPKASLIIDTKEKSYNLAGKYSIEAKHSFCVRLKACLFIFCTLSLGLVSERAREGLKGRKVRIIYTEEAVISSKSENTHSLNEVPIVHYNFRDDPDASLKSFQNDPMQLTKKVFDPISKPVRVKQETITVKELKNLLKNTSIFSSNEIIVAFKRGETSIKRPVIIHLKERVEFVRKTRQVMTYIYRQDEVTQSRFLKRLEGPFMGCDIGRVMIIRQIYDELFLNESVDNFENYLKLKLYTLKTAVLEEMACGDPHVLSAYIYQLGKQLGMNEVEEAKEMFNFYNYGDVELARFKILLTEKLDEFCQAVAGEINNPSESITKKYGIFVSERVDNKELPNNFGFYDDDKKAMGLYDKLNEPNDDQDSNLLLYTSPTEVKQLLALLGFIELKK